MTERRTDRQRNSTTIRKDVVIELRGIRKQYPASSRFFQLWRASMERSSREEGITRAEIAASFYSKVYEQNYDRALYLAKELISHFQKWKRNKSVVLRAAKDPGSRVWFYYNLKKPIELEKRTEANHTIIQGLVDADRRDLEILKLHPRRRRRLAEILLEEETLGYGYTG